MANIRFAVIKYENKPLTFNDKEGYSVGAMIDEHLFQKAKSGEMISEISLFFETPEEQHKLIEYYNEATSIPVMPEGQTSKSKKAY